MLFILGEGCLGWSYPDVGGGRFGFDLPNMFDINLDCVRRNGRSGVPRWLYDVYLVKKAETWPEPIPLASLFINKHDYSSWQL